MTIALTGGIASGKTTVADRLATLGAHVVDTDVISRALQAKGAAGTALIGAQFGPSMLAADGAVDRAALRRHVFEQPAARQALEQLMHPLIMDEMWRQMRQRAAGSYPVAVIPLLVETGADSAFAHIIVVDCPIEQQRARLMARDEIDGQLADQMIKAQAPRDRRLAVATHVIDNTGSLADLIAQTDALHADLKTWYAANRTR